MLHNTNFSAVFWVGGTVAAGIDAIYSALLSPSFDHRLSDAVTVTRFLVFFF